MRIITGSRRGRKLKTLPGDAVRPTPDRVKEALFNILQFDLEGRVFLDLFAGSGQIGLEALSRGAKRAVFVDSAKASCGVVLENIHTTGFENEAQVMNAEYASYLMRCTETFDIAFLDPPYGANLLRDTLERVTPHMNRGGLIVCESDAGQEMPERVGDFALARTYRYGRVHIWLYRWETVEPEED